MPKQLLVRNVPDEVHKWIDDQRQQQRMSQQEVILSVLQRATLTPRTLPLPFEQIRKDESVPRDLPFTFIDLFAGIGGFRLALDSVGGKCVFSSEWDKYSQKTYKAWFGEMPEGNIRDIKPADIPDHDILAAGFPCQPFSIAGVSKKKSLGRAHGFKCATQGTLFFNIASILEVKRPPVALLENVKNLQSHDKGRTWTTIKETLEDLDYVVFHKIIDAAGWVPQHRERVYIAALTSVFSEQIRRSNFPRRPRAPGPKCAIFSKTARRKYTLSNHLWNYLVEYAKKHKEAGNGFGFGLANLDGVTRTLSARYFKDGSEILDRAAEEKPEAFDPTRMRPADGI